MRREVWPETKQKSEVGRAEGKARPLDWGEVLENLLRGPVGGGGKL